MAQITAKWHESLGIFEGFQEECASRGFDVDLGIHLKNLVAFATGQSRFKTVGGLPIQTLKDAWETSKDGFRFALNFIRSNAGVDGPALLSSPFLILTVASFGHQYGYKLSPQQEAELRHWFRVANAKARYSRGSTETLLDQDLARIRDGKGAEGLVESLKAQLGRLDIAASELEGRNARSAYFKAMFLAFREDGAKDWVSNLAISLSHSGRQHLLQFHHIYPRAMLRGHYKPVIVNDIANLAFIGGRTNRKISNKPPAEYLVKVLNDQGHAAFRAQCIPTDLNLLTVERYPEFLAERRKLIAERLNRYLNDARTSIPAVG